mmetsp:Transcript_13054/g.42554  ORF Transcript_13054/g.42554 Transcript_13054/m.42554 type:complete len:326 (+) Transcript_13054:73-1050(+)|eukprot:CAMPEP_0118902008 /NCGR_PEP_ID=MMETSP1166-20130328/7482_1 /TAXON_ID=1104430 /ORGANISM="Chrysoreinhardia sp, Strain CCMP3193" /LENGTH=325 /DNA_ID=CAMNT_0006841203 /DNA_START=48 /DNA_END=1025 /DNA_ORIENTATION=+
MFFFESSPQQETPAASSPSSSVSRTFAALCRLQAEEDGLVLAEETWSDETAGDLDGGDVVVPSPPLGTTEMLREEVRTARRAVAKELTEAELRRFAAKHRGSDRAAADAVRRHVAWRAEERPRLSRKSWAPDVDEGVLRVHGRSRDGDAILLFDAGPWAPWAYGDTNFDCARQFRTYVAYRLEVAALVADAELGSSQFVIVVNMVDRPSLLRPVALRCVYAMVRLTFDHFPHRLKQAFLLGAPPLFSAAWNVIKPWLDDDTITRTHFVDDPDVFDVLHHHVSHDAATSIHRLRTDVARHTPPPDDDDPDVRAAADMVLLRASEVR